MPFSVQPMSVRPLFFDNPEIFQKEGGGGKIFPETEDLLHGTRPTNRGWGGQTYLYVEKQKYLNGAGGLSAAPALNPP